MIKTHLPEHVPTSGPNHCGEIILGELQECILWYEPFPCAECGHNVYYVVGKDRKELDGQIIPDSFLLPTCCNCGEYYFDQDLREQIEELRKK